VAKESVDITNFVHKWHRRRSEYIPHCRSMWNCLRCLHNSAGSQMTSQHIHRYLQPSQQYNTVISVN